MRFLYHATRDRFLGKIRKEGLRPKATKSFKGQIGEGLVYFAYDIDCAASYVECADNVPDTWEDDKIVILVVRLEDLDSDCLEKDPNIRSDIVSTVAYRGVVKPENLGIFNIETGRIEPLRSVKRLTEDYLYE